MQIEDILSKLKNIERKSNGYTARCPSHEDKHNSLSISQAKNGNILLHCHAGCSAQQVVTALGLKMNDLFIQKEKKQKKQIEAEYIYYNEYDKPLHKTIRNSGKSFLQARVNENGGWDFGLKDTKTIIYHLPEVKKAIAQGEAIYICEGEKDCDNLSKIGLTATTNPMGAGKWKTEYAQYFIGSKEVVILPDNDAVGIEHASQVAASLAGKAESIKILCLTEIYPDLSKKGDISDVLEVLGLEETLRRLSLEAAKTEAYTSPLASEAAEVRLIPFEFNDIGNAKRLVVLYGDTIRYCPEWKEWFYFSCGYWKEDIEGYLYAMARETIKKLETESIEEENEAMKKFVVKAGNHSRIEAMLEQAKTFTENDIPIVADRWDVNNSLICLKNVTVDFQIGEKTAFPLVREHRREDFITKQLPFDYDESATCPIWEQFLMDIIPDQETRDFVRRAIGYTLTGFTSEDMLFILHGSGSNGKSTFVETIGEMLGKYAKTIKPETLIMNDKSNAMKTEIASVCGARFVRTSEIDEGKRLSESLVKQMTGGDRISTRFLFGRDFEYDPTYKIWISTNHKPKIYGNDDGIWRRICLIPFEVTIAKEKRDKFLDLKLKKELPGIFNWAIKGLMEWKAHGLNPPEKVQRANAQYRSDEDVLQGFIDDCIEKTVQLSIGASELYDFYKLYCEQNGTVVLSSTSFGKKMHDDKGFEKTKSAGRMFYTGIRIREDVKENLKSPIISASGKVEPCKAEDTPWR